MNTMTHVRSRPLSPETKAKVARILKSAGKKQRIARIREALQNIIDAMDADWKRRREASLTSGAEPSVLMLEALAAAEDFDALMQEMAQ
jgi:hypothetical protein